MTKFWEFDEKNVKFYQKFEINCDKKIENYFISLATILWIVKKKPYNSRLRR